MAQSFTELVQEYIQSFGTAYRADRETGMSQMQLLKYQSGGAGKDVFTANMISRLLQQFSKQKISDAIFESVKRWEKKTDVKTTVRNRTES